MVKNPLNVPNNHKALVQLKPGQRGEISLIKSEELKMALLQMGISEGDELVHTGVAPFRDPISIMVNRTKVLIRKRDAENIWIKM